MSVTFGYNQPFSGIRSPDSFTASKVATLNASIQSCGLLKEPINGILVPNSKVLFVTSPNINSTTNSFSTLTDTLYIIFQTAANSFDAYFINYPISTTTFIPDAQTTSISFGPGCSDVVTYNRSNLVNQAGFPGAQDGATVNFNFAGNATYSNSGCNAPVSPLAANWTNPGTICNTSAPINLASLITGTTGGIFSGPGVNGNSFDPAGLNGAISITYTVSSGSCQRFQTNTFSVNTSPSASWNPPSPVCAGNSITLNSLISGGSSGGAWSGNGVSGGIFNSTGLAGQVAITYRVGTSPCQAISTQNITVISSVDASWNPPSSLCETAAELTLNGFITGTSGGSFSGNGVSNGVFNPSGLNDQVTITYKVGTGSCADSSAKSITITPAPPQPVIVGRTEYCAGQIPQALNVQGSVGATFKWYADSQLTNLVNSTQNYTPAITGGNVWVIQEVQGCLSIPQTATVTIKPNPANPIVPNDLNFCSGSTIPSITAAGGSGQFFWFSDSLFSNLLFTGNPYSPPSAGVIWVIEELNGCRGDVSKVILNSQPLVNAQIVPGGIFALCPGSSVLLSASGSTNITWSTGSDTPQITVTTPGLIVLTAMGPCNTSKDSVLITLDSVSAEFQTAYLENVAPFDVQITPGGFGSGNCTWTINDVSTSDPEDGSITLSSKGQYTITRICTSASGCEDRYTRIITAEGQQAELYVPNSFSPNGDGLNELFLPKGYGIEYVEVSIFNRWGEVVFQTIGLESGWDGTHLNRKVANGVYTYHIKGRDTNGSKFTRMGRVTLID
jgi:gliding motility-associated-like protein